jgi:hypothetical protein
MNTKIKYWAMRDTGDIGDVFAMRKTGDSTVSWIVTYLGTFSYRSSLTLRCMDQTFPKIGAWVIQPELPQAQIVRFLACRTIGDTITQDATHFAMVHQMLQGTLRIYIMQLKSSRLQSVCTYTPRFRTSNPTAAHKHYQPDSCAASSRHDSISRNFE